MRLRTRLALVGALGGAAIAAAVAYAAQGGSAATAAPAAADLHIVGHKEFAQNACGSCHVLVAAKAKGQVGPQLDESTMPVKKIVAIVAKGKKAMPAYKGRMSAKEIANVSSYIVKVRKKPSAGNKLFAKNACGSCHVLGALGAKGTAGPSLDGSKQSKAKIAAILKKGDGAMPSFAARMSAKEIAQLAAYIVQIRWKEAAAPPTTAEVKTGAEAWKKGGCGSCHALAAAGSTASNGPSLDVDKPTAAEIIETLLHGSEYGTMSSFSKKLTRAEMQLLADYIVSVRKP